jgi:hypothetical protein
MPEFRLSWLILSRPFPMWLPSHRRADPDSHRGTGLFHDPADHTAAILATRRRLRQRGHSQAILSLWQIGGEHSSAPELLENADHEEGLLSVFI